QSFARQTGTRWRYSFPQSIRACSAPAETRPRGPRYRKQCLRLGNLCGRFFPTAAPRRENQAQKDWRIDQTRTGSCRPLTTDFGQLSSNDFGQLSSNHPVRPVQHRLGNRQTKLLRSLEIDDEFKLRWLLHCQIGGPSAFQNLVHVPRDLPVTVLSI